MIFRQIDEIVAGAKTQTRRVAKDRIEHAIYDEFDHGPGIRKIFTKPNGGPPRTKWLVGAAYAVVPKRGAPTYQHNGIPLRIRITAIRAEYLQDITEEDARAEGVRNIEEYKALWDSINKKKGTRWEDNPVVWVLSFQGVSDG